MLYRIATNFGRYCFFDKKALKYKMRIYNFYYT